MALGWRCIFYLADIAILVGKVAGRVLVDAVVSEMGVDVPDRLGVIGVLVACEPEK